MYLICIYSEHIKFHMDAEYSDVLNHANTSTNCVVFIYAML